MIKMLLDKYEFTLKVISPLYMSGARKNDAEWRAPSVKGLMRWWFRVVGGTREEEEEIFGMAGDKKAKASPFILRCYVKELPSSKKDDTLSELSYFGFSLRRGEERGYFPRGNLLGLEILFYPKASEEIKRKALASLWLAVNLGGFGSRSRRLFGSLAFNSQPEEKINALFSNQLPFSPLRQDINNSLPHCLDVIADAIGVKKPLPLEIYLCNKRWRDLQNEYKNYRYQCLKRNIEHNRPEQRQALGLPLPFLKEYRFASQLIFKALSPEQCLLIIIMSFKLDQVVEVRDILKMNKDKMIKIMKEFCSKVCADKIYPSCRR